MGILSMFGVIQFTTDFRKTCYLSFFIGTERTIAQNLIRGREREDVKV